MSAPDAPPTARGGGWTAGAIYSLGFLTVISTLNYFDRSVLALVLPKIKQEMHVSDTALGVLSALVAIYAVVGLPMAALADRWSRRNVIAIGFGFWSVMTAFTGFAQTIWQLGIARFLMAVGESCGGAPSNAMISDLFSRERRALALAVFTCASSIAAIVYSPAAGYIADTYGWRVTFLCAGIPGVVLAAVFMLTVKEPRRGAHDDIRSPLIQANLGKSLGFLFGSSAFRWMILGSAFMGVYLYGAGAWGTTFLVRVHHMSLTQIGGIFGPLRGTIGASGIILGGVLASWLGRRNERWRCLTPALACLALAPCEATFYLADPALVWIPAMILSSFFAVMHQPPIYAALLSVAKPQMRAVAVSVNLLCATVVGQFGGPILIGALNDMLAPRFGELAIRYSMLVVAACATVGGLCFLMASRSIGRDVGRADA